MPLNTVIFDIDGLLIDSEPLWNEAATEIFKQYGITLTEQQYISTTGLRTKEFVDQWFNYFGVSKNMAAEAERLIITTVLKKIEAKGTVMNGVHHIFNFFHDKGFKIGLATSSPQELIDYVIKMIGIGEVVDATASAQELPYGKPHPQVYLDCAAKLNVEPTSCICFEDSFNGMIAAKAARMKCVVIPHHALLKEERWAAADLKLSSLQNFGDLHFGVLAT
jgi:sugar-phosphatase